MGTFFEGRLVASSTFLGREAMPIFLAATLAAD
jgi:hypothetical protein